MIRVFIPGTPDTHTQQQRKIAWSQHRTYLPKTVQQNKRNLCLYLQSAKHHTDGCPWDEPTKLFVRYWFPHPSGKTHSNVWKDTKPDCDNMLKALCDAIEKSGIVTNDSRIVSITVEKRYATKDHSPGTEIIIKRISDGATTDFFISEQTHSKGIKKEEPNEIH